MKFSAISVVAAVSASQVSAFVPSSSVGVRPSAFSVQPQMAKKSDYDLGDLGDLSAPVPAPAPTPAKKERAPKKEKAPKPEPAPKVEKPKPKSKKELRLEAEAAAKAEAEAALQAKIEAEAAAAKKKKKEKTPKKAPEPKAKAAPVAAPPAESDPNAGPIGVALGAAPLVAAPFVALSAARGTLQRTKERRDKIQAEIDAFEAAQAKKQINASVDGGDLTKALGLFGGAGAALGLILAAPFSNVDAPPPTPKAAIEKTVKPKAGKASETKAPSVVAAPKKAVKKAATKKVAKGAYDLDLEERVAQEEAVAAEDAADARAAKEVS
jgi:hypothetical protein